MKTLIAQLAQEAKIKEENVTNVKHYGTFITFQEKGYASDFSVNLTKTGRVKKNSLRAVFI